MFDLSGSPGAMRPVLMAVSEVARGLHESQGQRQFYALSAVQAQLQTSHVDAALAPWVFATFVSRDDFDALFAMREAPGTYRELRAALSAPAVREAVPEKMFETPEQQLEAALEWLGAISSALAKAA